MTVWPNNVSLAWLIHLAMFSHFSVLQRTSGGSSTGATMWHPQALLEETGPCPNPTAHLRLECAVKHQIQSCPLFPLKPPKVEG